MARLCRVIEGGNTFPAATMPRKRSYNSDPDPGRMNWLSDETGAAMGWDEIGRRMGVSRERVRQIYRMAMRKLRRNPDAAKLFNELCKDE